MRISSPENHQEPRLCVRRTLVGSPFDSTHCLFSNDFFSRLLPHFQLCMHDCLSIVFTIWWNIEGNEFYFFCLSESLSTVWGLWCQADMWEYRTYSFHSDFHLKWFSHIKQLIIFVCTFAVHVLMLNQTGTGIALTSYHPTGGFSIKTVMDKGLHDGLQVLHLWHVTLHLSLLLQLHGPPVIQTKMPQKEKCFLSAFECSRSERL